MPGDDKDLSALSPEEFAKVIQVELGIKPEPPPVAPGDPGWTCKGCQYVNSDLRDECRQCGESKHRGTGRTTRAVKEMCMSAMDQWGRGGVGEHIYVVHHPSAVDHVKQVIHDNWVMWVGEKRVQPGSGNLPAAIEDPKTAFRYLLDVKPLAWAQRARRGVFAFTYDHYVDELGKAPKDPSFKPDPRLRSTTKDAFTFAMKKMKKRDDQDGW
jgi:hypothetical protein